MPHRLRLYNRNDLDRIPQLAAWRPEERDVLRAVSAVLPFRVNNYVLDELIDWDKVPNDPLFRLSFPQPGMLSEHELAHMVDLVRGGASEDQVLLAAREIQRDLNPHPAGQMELNVPRAHGERLAGMQHKYRETVLFFPSQGQTCHAYCTYCFRWAQFVGLENMKFASREVQSLVEYLKENRDVRSVLFTGGDPLIMSTAVLRRYVEALLKPELAHITSIRIGSKALAWWPQRFVSDPDADDLLRLFEEVVATGRTMALMAHYSHPRELETEVAQEALRRLGQTGCVVRSQAPVVRHVNDDGATWGAMWRSQVRLGVVPYYMFVERDTGPRNYFQLPLARALEIFNDAFQQTSGLARTVRGPSMSTTPGKVVVDGISELNGEKVFLLKFLQGRDPSWAGRTFFARYDPEATWLDQLRPAFGEPEFFFAEGMRRIEAAGGHPWLEEGEEAVEEDVIEAKPA